MNLTDHILSDLCEEEIQADRLLSFLFSANENVRVSSVDICPDFLAIFHWLPLYVPTCCLKKDMGVQRCDSLVENSSRTFFSNRIHHTGHFFISTEEGESDIEVDHEYKRTIANHGIDHECPEFGWNSDRRLACIR